MFLIIIFLFKTFFANVDGSSTVVQKPIHVIFARYLRIVVDWCAMSSDKCSLRLEFVGSIVGKFIGLIIFWFFSYPYYTCIATTL